MKRSLTLLCILSVLASGLATAARPQPRPPPAPPPEPPAPAATPAVRKLLDDASRLANEKTLAEGLAAADRALEAALQSRDAAGEALAHGARASALTELRRTEEAL